MELNLLQEIREQLKVVNVKLYVSDAKILLFTQKTL